MIPSPDDTSTQQPDRASKLLADVVFNHLVLPAKLPQHEDLDLPQVGQKVIKSLIDACNYVAEKSDDPESPTWAPILRCLRACSEIHQDGHLDRVQLMKHLQGLGLGDSLFIHVQTQNAGLIIRRDHDPVFRDAVIFESFEASPKNEEQEAFLIHLATFLEQTSIEATKDFGAIAFKAGQTVYEYRNTAEPAMISSLLMAVLEENGRRLSPVILTKRVHDDVCWQQTTKPWRRLPIYLVLRVSLQRHLSLSMGAESGRAAYKFVIATLLATTLDNVPSHDISLERGVILHAKLARRLVKLDHDRERCQDQTAINTYEKLFKTVVPRLDASMQSYKSHAEQIWNDTRRQSIKKLPSLPQEAAPQDQKLTLAGSYNVLESVLSSWKYPVRPTAARPVDTIAKAAQQHLQHAAGPHHQLVNREFELCRTSSSTIAGFASRIHEYIALAMPLNADNAEGSSQMLLMIMELWVDMDRAACKSFSILADYHPMFHPKMLDCLLLASLHDMGRLRNIQLYLDDRAKVANAAKGSDGSRRTIFDDPSPGCFADRFFLESEDMAESYAKTMQEIEEVAAQAKARKLEEWEAKNRDFMRLSLIADTTTCTFIAVENHTDPMMLGQLQNVHSPACRRCDALKRLSRLQIQIYEHPLPENPAEARCVVFELNPPTEFAVYRDITWYLLNQFAVPPSQRIPSTKNPICFFGDLNYLRNHANLENSTTLASVIKPFMATHFANVKFPVLWDGDRDGVCRPCGPKPAYYDKETKLWPGRSRKFWSFTHHVPVTLPKNSPLASIFRTQGAEFLQDMGPSSNEILASQTDCPPGTATPDFMALQRICSGHNVRWINILTELASTNINFSTETTAVLMRHLAMQAGPPIEGSVSLDVYLLRKIHNVFGDVTFLSRLLDEMATRLESMTGNWREIYHMDTILTIVLRVYSLTPPDREAHRRARDLLTQARGICLQWTESLRQEIYCAKETASAARLQEYALWAALLCKRTFAIYVGKMAPLEPDVLRAYIESAISVHECHVTNIQALPSLLRTALISDFRQSWSIRVLLYASLILGDRNALRDAISSVWPEAEGSPARELTKIVVTNGWASCSTVATAYEDAETIDFNIVEGLLLVGRRPLGKLPQDRIHLPLLTELFGGQALMALPSTLNRMDYVLCIRPSGYQVHVGFTEGRMIIRIKGRVHYYELIPRDAFWSNSGMDLPGPLIDRRFHWMNLNTGIVSITEPNHPWDIPASKWELDWKNRRCTMKADADNDMVTVIDPYSRLFKSITSVFKDFELTQNMLVYQLPDERTGSTVSERHQTKGLVLSLERLQLQFFVNKHTNLFSPQLRCEIDPDQDAGTWYGLQSKLVCRAQHDKNSRSILVPLGNIQIQTNGEYATSWTETSGNYGTFRINKVLGRIDCAAEPLLLYTKALLHAYTSNGSPDPLTGRTGTEEAIAFLASAFCQPWVPLSAGPLSKLISLAKLTPRHVYYPEDLKVLKNSLWNESPGTTTMQHEAFRPLVDRILAMSSELAKFSSEDRSVADALINSEMPKASADLHLGRRSMIRRQLYERHLDGFTVKPRKQKTKYASRDNYQPTNLRHRNVLELASLIAAWPQKICTTDSLAQDLSQSGLIGGFVEPFHKVALSDRLKVNIFHEWGSLILACREKANDPWGLAFLLCPIAFDLHANMPLIKSLAAFAMYEELRQLPLPNPMQFKDFRPNELPQLKTLCKLIAPFRAPFVENDEYALKSFASNKTLKKLEDSRRAHEDKSAQDARVFAQHLLEQWPIATPKIDGLGSGLLINTAEALAAITPDWWRLYENLQLSGYLDAAQAILTNRASPEDYEPPALVTSEQFLPRPMRGGEVPRLRVDLLKRKIGIDSEKDRRIMDAAQAMTQPPKGFAKRERGAHANNAQGQNQLQPDPTGKTVTTTELSVIISVFSDDNSLVRKRYAEDLLQSLDAFKQLLPTKEAARNLANHNWASSNGILKNLEQNSKSIKSEIIHALELDGSRPSRRVKWLKDAQLWPAMTTVTILQQIATSEKNAQWGSNVKEKIIQFGVSLTKLQREYRLRSLATRKDEGRYRDESNNWGHINWAPGDYPDWLLLELEANVLLRPDQVDVALATISPASKANSVLQMNMGQGKTSCIIPMAAVILADRESLARVIVPKSLRLQTAQLLQARLGGLLNRAIRHIPFSRRSATSPEHIKAYWNLHATALKAGAVIICQPEHNLSFMLSGRQRLLDNKFDEAKAMIEAHSWITSRSRDILDESDYTLAVRTQLIYPSGAQVSVDGYPHRWQVAEALLHLVNQNLDSLAKSHPSSIEVVRRPGGGYPAIHFLRTDVEEELLRRLTSDILAGRGGILPMNSFEAADRIAIKEFIQNDGNAKKIRPTTLKHIHNLCPSRPSIRQTVYLVRGLLVNRILMMTLKKRWNVHYGLHPERDPIAVPYHAKGVPSLQSEWGHPDVSILFTCLAFYYDGISKNQLKQCLEHVFRSDDPSGEYDQWVQHEGRLAESLRTWKSVNVDDEGQINQLWARMRYTTVVVDYFLNNFVFPLYAKQFKVKLQSSGWDIPLFSIDQSSVQGKENIGKPPKAISTGFSGTNDNRTMLPLTITQQDLPALAHTNAEVLTYLLHERSRKCIKIRNQGEQATELDFLMTLHQQGIRVLIDAGAVILEMNNKDLAKAWLDIDKSAPGVLFFDETSKPWIMGRSESLTPLLASPFAEDLGSCLVYLDEAHTRGTDLKLPFNACGALTLSLGQTKDHTVQAAMRLRQLGTTQSVRFFAPPEVWHSILDFQEKAPNQTIDSGDVISWLLNNTCDGIEQLQPLYYAQGNDFCRRMDALSEAPHLLSDEDQRQDYVAAIKQAEQQSLSQLYEPVVKTKARGTADRSGKCGKVAGFMQELRKRRRAFQDTGKAVHGSALEVVEQEREVAFEVESVRQVKQPERHPALAFSALHQELEVFARTGRLAAQPRAIAHAFSVMARTAVGRKFRVSAAAVTKPQLFVSNEYERTVRLAANQPNDNFSRPVQWILWSEQLQVAIILVPEEAELVVPILRERSPDKGTYLMTYAAPVTRKMGDFDQLKFFSIPELPKGWCAPSWLRVQLGIFAGRLFFDWEDYGPICEFMGVDGNHVTPDGDEEGEGELIAPESSPEQEGDADVAPRVAPRKPDDGEPFSSMPLTCMQEWLSIRRYGQDFVQTPMGFLTQGKTLQKEQAFFSR